MAQGLLADALALEVIPDELVGIELGGVAGQEVQLQSAFQALDVLSDDLRYVGGVAVENKKDLASSAPHEVAQQFDEARRVEPLGVDLVPERTARIDGGDCVDALAPSAGGNFGRLPTQPPGASENLVGANSRLVQEEDRRSGALGAGPKRR